MSDLVERIATIIDAHPQGISRGAPDDQCANCPDHPDRWISHVSRALISELGLKREMTNELGWQRSGPIYYRYVTDWKADDE
jgi:hypothetical protein